MNDLLWIASSREKLETTEILLELSSDHCIGGGVLPRRLAYSLGSYAFAEKKSKGERKALTGKGLGTMDKVENTTFFVKGGLNPPLKKVDDRI